MELIYNPNVNEDGKLLKSVSEQIKAGLLNFKGKKVTITITDEVDRTAKQNRLWWLYMTLLSEETGNTVNEMHEIAKSMFIPYATSTTELTQIQFSKAITELKVWAASYLKFILPDES